MYLGLGYNKLVDSHIIIAILVILLTALAVILIMLGIGVTTTIRLGTGTATTRLGISAPLIASRRLAGSLRSPFHHLREAWRRICALLRNCAAACYPSQCPCVEFCLYILVSHFSRPFYFDS